MTLRSRAETAIDLVKKDGVRVAARSLTQYVLWRLRGKPGLDHEYLRWIELADAVPPQGADHEVGFTIVMPVYNTEASYLRAAVESVRNQTHARWQLLLVDDCSTRADTLREARVLAQSDARVDLISREENGGIAAATNSGIAAADMEWLAFMDHDDLLHPRALEWFSSVAEHADLIYSDEDKVDAAGRRHSPTWKPAWSPRLLLGINYVNHLTAVRTDIAREVGGIREGFDGAQDHDFLLRLAELPDLRVVHVPHVLYHWRIWPESYSQTTESSLASEKSGLRAVGDAVSRRSIPATVGLGPGTPFNYRPRFNEGDPLPSVKIVIPTRDRVKLLRRCVESIFNRTDGVDYHLVIVDNGSVKQRARSYLRELSQRDTVTVLRIDDAFNYSALCNAGATAGPEAEYILFLNNDVEVLSRRWLQQMSGWLTSDSDVCAVGSKLYYQDGTIQHAGVVLGLGGVAGHYADGRPDEPVLNVHHDQIREVSAVTAASLLVRRVDFERVGGFNEDLPLVYQDIDLCLRLAAETGGSVLYDPTYPALHVGSASRPKHDPVQTYGVYRFRMLWRDRIAAGDPYYSPHLTLDESDFSLAAIPSSRDEFESRFEPRASGVKP